MGSENHHHPLHHQFYHKNLQIHHRSTFLPMLCSRPSIKDVSLPQCRGRARSFSNDPQSPRIGCAGQVKRHNKIAGLPTSHRFSLTPKSTKSTTTTANTISSSPVVKYSKLKRLFSGKNMSTTATSTVIPTAPSCEGRPQPQQPQVTINTNSVDVPRKQRCRNENLVPISIENMDPPLPVIKRVHMSEEDSQVDSLWKRRSGGGALRSLQLQQIHNPRRQLQVTSV